MENKTYPLEISDILKGAVEEYKQNYSLCPVQKKAVLDICYCRTKESGGHTNQCDNCGHTEHSYNSCRNRHCPKCQYIKQEQWVDKLANSLLPTKYYHIVFTIPEQLHSVFYLNQRECYDILFRASSKALQKAGSNPEYIGVQTGALSVLHTWTQAISYHPHIHMLVPAGGITYDGMEWKSSRKKFFLPVKVLSKIFRGITVKLLKEGIGKGTIRLPENISGYECLKPLLYKKDWNVYLKKSFGGVNSVLKYLARYTHRVAISNSRLVSFNDKQVAFRYKDNKDNGKQKVMALDASEFIKRFLQHILPNNFYKIRYTGILANTNSKTLKEQCIALIGKQMFLPALQGLTAIEVIENIFKKDFFTCPICKKGIMRLKIPI